MSFELADNKSVPLNKAVPDKILPGGFGINPKTDIMVTDFPEPDSPTMPKV